jgi:hypothetical protein
MQYSNCWAGDPYSITYSQHMQDVGTLEISFKPVLGRPKSGNSFFGWWHEYEYAATAWWTKEFYVTGQSTRNEGNFFTGYRFEDLFRLLPSEHWINPVLYVEFEEKSSADKILKGIVGFDSQSDIASPS